MTRTTRLRRMSSGLAIVAAIVVMGLLPAAPARADDAASARDHYERGTKFYDIGKYDDAIKEFEGAYEAKSDPAFLYNLAQSHRLAGHTADALRLYRNYLRYVPKAPNRADIEEKIKVLEKTAAEHPEASPAPAPVPSAPVVVPLTASPPEGPAPAPIAPPGSSPYPPQYPAQYPPTDSQLGAVPAAPPLGAPPPAPVQTSDGARSGRRVAGVVVASIGGAFIVGGAISGLIAKSEANKVNSAATNHERFDPSVESAGKHAETVEWIGLGVGAAAVVAGLIIYATAPAAAEAAAPAPPRVALAPLAAPRVGGALLQVTF